MPGSAASPVVLLSSEAICVETFRRFGIEYLPDQAIPQEALRVLEFLARPCLPIIGEHCRDAARLHKRQLKASEERAKKNQDDDSAERISSSIEDARRKHKRLRAQREVDRTVSLSCRALADALNRGGSILQKTAPLLPVPRILSRHLQSLQQIHVPKLVRPEGNLPSLTKFIVPTPSSDEFARYSVLCFLQKRVVDYRDGERAISVLQNAVAEISHDLHRVTSTPRDSRVGDNMMNMFARVGALKKLSQEVQKICTDRENLSVQDGKNVAKKLTEILTNKSSRCGELRQHEFTDTDQVLTMRTLQEDLVGSLQRLGVELESIEDMDDAIKASFGEICNSRELKIASNFLPIQRNPYHTPQPVSVICAPQRNASVVFHETILEDELDTQMEKLDIDPQENCSALEYLASMEFGVDGSSIHSIISIPTRNIDDAVNELTNIETICFLRECAAAQ